MSAMDMTDTYPAGRLDSIASSRNQRIRVNAIAIGSVMSASLQVALKDNRDFRKDIERHTPLGRVAAANELVLTAQYLASDASSFMTGRILTVDGGRTLLDPVAAPAH